MWKNSISIRCADACATVNLAAEMCTTLMTEIFEYGYTGGGRNLYPIVRQIQHWNEKFRWKVGKVDFITEFFDYISRRMDVRRVINIAALFR